MQPLASWAIAVGVVMIVGVSTTLVLTRHASREPHSPINRWQLHGTIPLAAAGLVLGVISRSGGQSPGTHDVTFTVVIALFAAALLCSLAGAGAGTRHQRTARQ